MNAIDVESMSFYSSRLDDHRWDALPFRDPSYPALLGTLENANAQSLEKFKIFIKGIDAVAAEKASPGYRISRIEFVCNGPTMRGFGAREGAILFSGEKGAMLHCRDAKLGYGGAGSWFSSEILQLLGAGGHFDSINQLASKGYYHIVVSRERTARNEGVEAVMATAEPLSEWRRWRLR